MINLKSTLEAAALLPKGERDSVLRAVGEREYKKCANDFFYWVDPREHDDIPYVWTVDRGTKYMCRRCKDAQEHLASALSIHLEVFHNIKTKNDYEALGFFDRLPQKRAFPWVEKEVYMRPMCEAWLAYRFHVWEKSRDMMATWLALCLYTWDTAFHEGRENIFQSEDANKTLELVRRANQIYTSQPKFLREVHKATFIKGDAKSGILDFQDLDSKILGFAQGGDQIRMYHPSGLFQDEAAFQPRAEEGFTAVKPALVGGGRFTAVSSANPSFFQLLAQDRSGDED